MRQSIVDITLCLHIKNARGSFFEKRAVLGRALAPRIPILSIVPRGRKKQRERERERESDFIFRFRFKLKFRYEFKLKSKFKLK